MKRLLLSVSLSAFFLVACQTETTTTPAPPSSRAPNGDETGSGDPAASSDDAAPKDSPKGIGTLEEKGLAIVDGDPNAPMTCADLCKGKGGKCVLALEPEDGTGPSIAGYARYVFVKPGQPAGFLTDELESCASPVTATRDTSNDTGSLEEFACTCDAVPVSTRAVVEASEGVHTCKEVCSSWGKTCTNDRKWDDVSEGGALALYGPADAPTTKPFNCATKPDAEANGAALARYLCACE